MRLFLRLFIAYYFGYTNPSVTLYMPLKLIWLEIEWPGMWASLWPEPTTQSWFCGQLAVAIDFVLLYSVVYLCVRSVKAVIVRHRGGPDIRSSSSASA